MCEICLGHPCCPCCSPKTIENKGEMPISYWDEELQCVSELLAPFIEVVCGEHTTIEVFIEKKLVPHDDIIDSISYYSSNYDEIIISEL